MRTEKELLVEARRFQKLAISLVPHGDPTSRRLEGEYQAKFELMAWALDRDSFGLWLSLLDKDRRDETPLLTRLSRLTNPAPSGRILEPKE